MGIKKIYNYKRKQQYCIASERNSKVKSGARRIRDMAWETGKGENCRIKDTTPLRQI